MSRTHLEKLPTLSVVIAAYNEASSIKQCLDALHPQREDILEIIVVDNNSTDATVQIIRDCHYPEVRVIKEPQQGIIYARNTGLAAAKGDLLARIDADTYADPGWARAVREFFADPHHDQYWGGSGPVTFYDAPLQNLTRFLSNFFVNTLNTVIGGKRGLYGCNQVVRAESWKQILPHLYPHRGTMEDLDVTLHIRKLGGDIATIPGMSAASSVRRIATFPHEYWKYNAMWPRTYWVHGQYVTAIVMTLTTYVIDFFQLLVFPLLMMYDPETKRFSLKRLFKRSSVADRDIP